MKIPRFSITIPIYKQQFLKECIDSVLAQTFTDFEVILVNDASPEDIDSIINQYNDNRLQYYKNEKNCGAVNVVDNWNKCLSYAKGEYLICMGDDDKLLPDCLEEYSRLIDKYPNLGIYHAWSEIINEKSEFYSLQASRPEYESVYSLLWNRWDNRKYQFIGDFLFETRTLKANGGFYKLPLAWGTDDISALIAAKRKGIANTQKVIFQYRINPHTISSTGNVKIKMDAIEREKRWYKEFLREIPIEELEYKYYQLCLIMLKLHFQKKQIRTITIDITQNSIIHILYWLRQKKKYNISIKMIVYAILESIKRKQLKK